MDSNPKHRTTISVTFQNVEWGVSPEMLLNLVRDAVLKEEKLRDSLGYTGFTVSINKSDLEEQTK